MSVLRENQSSQPAKIQTFQVVITTGAAYGCVRVWCVYSDIYFRAHACCLCRLTSARLPYVFLAAGCCIDKRFSFSSVIAIFICLFQICFVLREEAINLPKTPILSLFVTSFFSSLRHYLLFNGTLPSSVPLCVTFTMQGICPVIFFLFLMMITNNVLDGGFLTL